MRNPIAPSPHCYRQETRGWRFSSRLRLALKVMRGEHGYYHEVDILRYRMAVVDWEEKNHQHSLTHLREVDAVHTYLGERSRSISLAEAGAFFTQCWTAWTSVTDRRWPWNEEAA